MSSAAGVYKGRWTDWEHGSITGMRITMSASTGQILLAAIALFLGMCGLQSWSICRLLLHQMRSNSGTDDNKTFPVINSSGGDVPRGGRPWEFGRDSLDQGTELPGEEGMGEPPTTRSAANVAGVVDNKDMQFILRNSTAFDAILRISKLSISRIYHGARVQLSGPVSPGAGELPSFSHAWAILIIIIALLNLTVWPIAAVFSSLVARSDYPVLISSPHCGYYVTLADLPNSTMENATRAHNIKTREGARTRTADEYIQSCYRDDDDDPSHSNSNRVSNSPLCRRFITRQIPWKPEPNAPCPFANGTCLQGEKSAFGMDTGYLDSHDVFGMNTPPDQRILYRRKTVCSPVVTKPYGKLINGTLPGEEVAVYYYGGIKSPEERTFFLSTYAQRSPAGYTIRSYIKLKFIPELTRPDADVSLFFIIPGSVAYLGPIDDPVFAAHRETDDDWLGKIYNFDRMASVLACADQHQFCNPSIPRGRSEMLCTPLKSSGDLMTLLTELDLTDLQQNITYTLQSNVLWTDMYFSDSGRGSEALLAGRTVFDGINVQLPDDQWTKEVSNWFNLGLVRLQFSLLEYVTGPAGPIDDGTTQMQTSGAGASAGDPEVQIRYNGTSIQTIYDNTCLLQKVGQFELGGGYLTFHVLGLALIIALGGFILVLGVGLEILIEWLPKHGWGSKRRQAWIQQDRWVVWKKLRGQR